LEVLEGQTLADWIGAQLRFHCVELRFGPACQRAAFVAPRTSTRPSDFSSRKSVWTWSRLRPGKTSWSSPSEAPADADAAAEAPAEADAAAEAE
jgi:hypothetical protein